MIALIKGAAFGSFGALGSALIIHAVAHASHHPHYFRSQAFVLMLGDVFIWAAFAFGVFGRD